MDLGDPPVGDPRLLAGEHPLVLGLVVTRLRGHRGDIGAGLRFGDAERRHLRVVLVAVALGHPLGELVRRAGGEDSGDGEGGAEERHADSGVAPEQLLVGYLEGEPRRVAVHVGEGLESVETDPGRLLDDRPGRLLAGIPFGGRRAHHLGGEAVHPVTQVLLFLGEREGEVAHRPQAFGMSK